MWMYMSLLSMQVKESNAWGAGIGLTQNTYPSFCHVLAKMATHVPANLFAGFLNRVPTERPHNITFTRYVGLGMYIKHIKILRPILICHFI